IRIMDLLGDDWVQKHRRVVQQHANQYKRIAWAKIFNGQFETLNQRQSQWTVLDTELRETLRLEVLLPTNLLSNVLGTVSS
ncbi:exocyst complex component EXO70A1-like protein, partial [Tanacetum coccineum]